MKRNKSFFRFLLYCLVLGVVLCGLNACRSEKQEGESDPPPPSVYESYDVTFDLGTGESFTAESSVTTGKVEEPEKPERAGYRFDGWYETNSYDTVFDFDARVESDLTAYAKWVKNKNKIHFMGDGATSGEMTDFEAETDTTVRLPVSTFRRGGYTFMGWAETDGGSVKNKDGGWFYMDARPVVTLFAVWQANRYPLFLENCGGEPDRLVTAAVYDDALPALAAPIKPGFVFAGYFTQAGGKGERYYDEAMEALGAYLSTSETTLFAHWIAADNTLTFAGNGSTGGVTGEIEAKTSERVALPECGFLRTGYTFGGWNTRADGSGESYKPGDRFVMPVSENAVTLYVTWIANRYFVLFDDNAGGERVATEHVYAKVRPLGANPFVRHGYEFVAWNISPDGTGNYFGDGQEVVNLCPAPEGEVVLYAVWSPVVVTIRFDKTGGQGGTGEARVTFGANFPAAIAPAKVGYTFGGYYAEKNGKGTQYLDGAMLPVCVSDIGEEGVSVFALWIPDENQLIFDANGGQGEITVSALTESVISLTKYTFSRVGYDLAGWNLTSDGSGTGFSVSDEFTMPGSVAAVRLYAVWEAKSVTVKFIGNGSDAGDTGQIESVSDGVITLPSCGFRKTGYAFTGWSITPDGNEIYGPASRLRVPPTDSETLNLYARWQIEIYAITYRLGGGTNSAFNPTEYHYESGAITLSNPTKAGYTFAGWSEGTGIPANSTGERTFTANWSLITYTITYVLNGGVNNPANPVGYTVISPNIELLNPTKNGSTFEGWSEGNRIESGSTGNRTFTAQWSGNMYSITYQLDGGENGAGNPGSYMMDSDTIVLADPSREGYEFVGWTCTEMGISGPVKSVSIPRGSSGSRTFQAHWRIITYRIAYVLNGGTNAQENPVSYTMLDDDIMLYDPVRTGYVFDGWIEGGLIGSGTTGDLTFTATWTALTYSVYIFDGRNEDPVTVNYTLESGSIVIEVTGDTEKGASYSVTIGDGPAALYDVIHYGNHLVGWYEGTDDTAAKASFIIEAGSTGNRFITAKWEPIVYTVTYDLGEGGINHESNPAAYTIMDGPIDLFDPSREGYVFSGWQDENGQVIASIPAGSYGNRTLKALWTSAEPVDPPIDPPIDPPDPPIDPPIDPVPDPTPGPGPQAPEEPGIPQPET